jgi:hypothetical protein
MCSSWCCNTNNARRLVVLQHRALISHMLRRLSQSWHVWSRATGKSWVGLTRLLASKGHVGRQQSEHARDGEAGMRLTFACVRLTGRQTGMLLTEQMRGGHAGSQR